MVNIMKNRILTFIIGIFVGAIIMTLVFLIIGSNFKNNENFFPNENGKMDRPNGNMGEPPEKPNGDMMAPPQFQ